MQKFLVRLMLVSGLAVSPLMAQQTVRLEEALAQKMVLAQFAGNDASVHYLKPLQVHFKNQLATALQVQIAPGTYFSSQPVNFQDITVMQDLLVKLLPGEAKTVEVYGVCTEAHLAAPNSKVSYVLQAAPKKEFVQLAQFVNEKKYYGTAEAQHAMWALSNDHDWRAIYASTDEGRIGREIRNYLAQDILGIELELGPDGEMIMGRKTYRVVKDGAVVNQYTYLITEEKSAPQCEMSGTVRFSNHQAIKMRVGMFDDRGTLVREIYYNDQEKPGMHQLTYHFDCDEYQDPVYHFKIIRDDRVSMVNTLRKIERK
ncbi:MAG: hypothetical protein OHK0053_37700 [Microscillaceae bacterium]